MLSFLPLRRIFIPTLLCFHISWIHGQILNLETIMQDPKWIGSQPKNPVFTADGKKILFLWNPENETIESSWAFPLQAGKTALKLDEKQASGEWAAARGKRNREENLLVYAHQNTLFLRNLKTGKENPLLKTGANIESPSFLTDGNIAFLLGGQPFLYLVKSGEFRQLFDFKNKKSSQEKKSAQDSLLAARELELFSSLRSRKDKQEQTKMQQKKALSDTISVFDLQGKTFSLSPAIAPSGKYLAFQLKKEDAFTTANVPSYINQSGFTQEIPTRENVGIRQSGQSFFILNIATGKALELKPDDLPGIEKQPDFYQNYPKLKNQPAGKREFYTEDFRWNEDGTCLLADVRSFDNKDRWLMLWEESRNVWRMADHQRDEAWIGGPAAESGGFGFLSAEEIWFLSEASGFSHLYRFNFKTNSRSALTSGKFEVSDVQYRPALKAFFFLANPEHPGEHSVHRLDLEKELSPKKITRMKGGHEFILSPDGQSLAYRFSSATQPWELFWQESNAASGIFSITTKAASDAFKKLKISEPEYVQIPARDGAKVPARLYRPEAGKKNGAAVIFVHGAGYLQNAHKHWSHYFREFLFHQMLMREGFSVLDLDYRGSAGYGRDWRTGIYRHMGGRDLNDQIDAARFLHSEFSVDSTRIGIYGGSYGGFITLMALCTRPGIFRCGAALRSVTDWMHYNHGYTSNILNCPLEDSLAYHRSSPINFAEGLQGRLLMCHGMLDLNVHYQDIVRFSQRLIELGKENWELASYPLEDHGFTEPESWLDEYRRIYKLFREELLPKR